MSTTEFLAPPAAFTSSKLRGIIKKQGGHLVIAEVDGALWASDTYWAAPVEYVRPLLSDFNLEPKVGRYEVGTKVEYVYDGTSNLSSIIGAHDAATKHVLQPVMVGNHQSYARVGDGLLVAVFTTPEGDRVGVRDDFLRIHLGVDWESADFVLAQDVDSIGKPVGVYRRTTSTYTMQNPWRTVETVNVGRTIVMPFTL
jgi:hypothetical protein